MIALLKLQCIKNIAFGMLLTMCLSQYQIHINTLP